MGLKCFLVAILLAYCSQSVFARNCNNILDNPETLDCNECIRCGGFWCNDPKEIPRCVKEKKDGWCKLSLEVFEDFTEVEPSNIFDPWNVKKMAVVAATSVTEIRIDKSALPIDWKPQNPLETFKIVNTSQSNDFDINVAVVGGQPTNVKTTTRQQMKLRIKTTIREQFCSANSTRFEHVYVKTGLKGIDEEVTLEYQVPCACQCQDTVEVNAAICNGHGNFSCGVCHCTEERFGTYCNKTNRGDIQTPCRNNCFGNGICKDGSCECFNDKSIEGSKYFVMANNCEDICSATSTYTNCLQNPETGFCKESDVSYAYIDKVDNSSLAEVDGEGRRVWVRCNVTLRNCGLVEYAAMKTTTEDGHVEEDHLMVFRACGANQESLGAGKLVTVPVVFCVLALLAAAAAGAGYVVWKARGPPPLPLADPQYANIDAEDCIGENPLYKPPTSSFKNPMYGKC